MHETAKDKYASGKNWKDQWAHNSMLTFEDLLKSYLDAFIFH